MDFATNKSKLIFDTRGMWKVSFSVAPGEEIIGVLVSERGVGSAGAHDYSVLPRNHMLFLDTAGDTIATLDRDVRKFAWSPDGSKLAFIAGTYYEGGIGFKPTNAGIFDIVDGSIRAITSDFPHESRNRYDGPGIEISWARHDGNIYIHDFDYGAGNYRYNVHSGKSEPVNYKGIDFSPDGTYYLGDWRAETNTRPRLYLTATNEDLTERLSTRFGADDSRMALYWRFDRGHCLHVIREVYGKNVAGSSGISLDMNVLYDPETDRILKEITMAISSWASGPGKLILDNNGQPLVLTYRNIYGEE